MAMVFSIPLVWVSHTATKSELEPMAYSNLQNF